MTFRELESNTLADGDAVEGLPLSFAQQRLWFLDQFEPGSSLYNIPIVLDLEGTLDVPLLERVLTEIVRRHDTLRTFFTSGEGQPRQHVSPPAPFPLEVLDLSSLEPDARPRIVEARITESADAPFDLATGPLFSARLLKLGPSHHVFIGAVHHIVSDKWSSGIFMRELTTLYEAYLAGGPSPLDPLPMRYAEFAKSEREWLQGGVLERELDYWRSRLEPPRSELDLPTDHPRPPVASYRGGREWKPLAGDLTGSLERVCRGERVTLYMGFLAVFAVLLHRYTGQTDLIIGSPVANRVRRETEGLIGFFVNTLPLRLDLSGSPTFRELLGRVKDVALGAFEHQSLPFERLVEELNPERSLSHSPIFQTVLNFHNTPGDADSGTVIGPLRVRRRSVMTPTAKFDLTLTLRREAGGLGVGAEYASDLFEAQTIHRLVEHFEQLLTSATDDPDQSISLLRMLTSRERSRFLTTAGGTDHTGGDLPVSVLIEQQASRTPGAPAIRCDGAMVTYAELEASSNRLAHHLGTVGVGPGTLVGICLDRNVDMVASILAVMKAGGAYVPLDPDFPSDRLHFMAADAELPVVITQTTLATRLESIDARQIFLDEISGALARYPATSPATTVEPDALAYVLYTSGSTGRPKGVEVPHAALTNLLHAMRVSPGVGPNDVLAAVTTLSFDIAMLELLLPLMVGGQVALMTRDVASDGKRLADALERDRVTVMQATPATYQMLIDSGWRGSRTLKVLCGGEALAPTLATALVERAGSVWNLYGPTETTIWSTVDHVEPGASITIGRPIANTDVYVLDSCQQLLPIGVPGELYIGGTGLARGYRNRGELTAERFVSHPFSNRPGARLYRTGDRVRWRPDGRLDYLGRTDHQVKLRGFRIELGEIETVLAKHPEVAHAVVVVREDAPGDKRLVAYLISGGRPISIPTLLSFVEHQLPAYMVPSAFVPLDAFPLTPNGKIDRRALPAPHREPSDEAQTARPRTSSEERVAAIWSEVLGVREVGVDDDFFDLGGHSLLATRIVSRLRREFGVDVPLRTLFEAPTVAMLAQHLQPGS